MRSAALTPNIAGPGKNTKSKPATLCLRAGNERAISDRAEVYRRRFVGIRPRTSVLRGAEK
jgi:hypothetical protein